MNNNSTNGTNGTTFVPYGDMSKMRFASIANNKILYVNNGIQGITIPTTDYTVLTGSSLCDYTWSYVTPLHFGLASNKNLMFYSTTGTENKIKGTELPVDPNTGFMLVCAQAGEYKFMPVTGSYTPAHHHYTGFTISSNSCLLVNNSDMASSNFRTVTSSGTRSETGLLQFDVLNPTHSYQFTTTLRLWLLDYTYINPGDNCTIANFKENVASRVKVVCNMLDSKTHAVLYSHTLFDALVGNVTQQAIQITQTEMLPCRTGVKSENLDTQYLVTATNGGAQALVWESTMPCFECTLTEIPNTIYIGAQPVMECYEIVATCLAGDPVWLSGTSIDNLRSNDKITWKVTSNLQGTLPETATSKATLYLYNNHYYQVYASVSLFMKNPNVLSPATNDTVATWKAKLPVFNLVWTDTGISSGDGDIELSMAQGMYSNIALPCYEFSGSCFTPLVTSDHTSNMLLKFVSSISLGGTGLNCSLEVITPCIRIILREL